MMNSDEEFYQAKKDFSNLVRAKVNESGTMLINDDKWLEYLRENKLRPIGSQMVKISPNRWVLGIRVVGEKE